MYFYLKQVGKESQRLRDANFCLVVFVVEENEALRSVQRDFFITARTVFWNARLGRFFRGLFQP